MRLKDKTALVTGSSKGIGEAIAIKYTEEGASVIINGTNIEDLKNVEEKVKRIGGRVLAIAADLTNSKAVQNMVGLTLKHFGKIDILVNNAGKLFVGTVEEVTEEEWDRALDVNLKSVFLCSKFVIPHMKKRKYGRIINMSSAGGKNPRTITGTNYGVTKAGIIYFTKRIANDYGKDGITANCIAPGPIDTEMSRSFPSEVLSSFTSNIPLGRMGTPEDVAKVALFLASDDADYVTGEVIDVNGGSYID